MTKLFTPLAPNVPIVDKDGNPTPYFARLMQELSDSVVTEIFLEGVGGDPGQDAFVVWDTDTETLTFASLSEVLDWSGANHGDILFRGAATWQILPAGTDGDVLTTNGASADPTWETPTSGGDISFVGSFNVATIGDQNIDVPLDADGNDEYLVTVKGKQKTGDATIFLRLSSNNGSSFYSGATDYQWVGKTSSSSGTTVIHLTDNISVGTGKDVLITFKLVHMNTPSQRPLLAGSYYFLTNADAPVGGGNWGGLNSLAANDFNAFQILVGGTADADDLTVEVWSVTN